jgi:hypothetical protein
MQVSSSVAPLVDERVAVACMLIATSAAWMEQNAPVIVRVYVYRDRACVFMEMSAHTYMSIYVCKKNNPMIL